MVLVDPFITMLGTLYSKRIVVRDIQHRVVEYRIYVCRIYAWIRTVRTLKISAKSCASPSIRIEKQLGISIILLTLRRRHVWKAGLSARIQSAILVEWQITGNDITSCVCVCACVVWFWAHKCIYWFSRGLELTTAKDHPSGGVTEKIT